MTKKALVVGVNYYSKVSPLYGCVNDASRVGALLEFHADGSRNFEVKQICSTDTNNAISKKQLKDNIAQLFSDTGDIALLYFAGHGHFDVTGGYICSSDVDSEGNDGVSLAEIMVLANKSKIANKVIILDSCHGGIAGASALNDSIAEINDGVTILTASTKDQYALESGGGGVFTNLLVNALTGAAANLVGDVSPGSIYAHIDQSLGAWSEQRPVFKTNVKRFISLRKVQPPLLTTELRRINEFFPSPGYHFPLDPTYEPARNGSDDMSIPSPDPLKTPIFKILQNFNRVGLVVPLEAEHMYYAAMGSKSVKLTALGEHYRSLAALGRI